MKKLFLLFVLATGFVACDKNDDMADINSLETKELTVAEINSEINGFVDSIGDSTTSKVDLVDPIGNTCDLTSTELEIMLRAFNSISVDRGFVSYDYRYWMTTSNTLYGIISISYSNGTGGRYIFGPAGGRGGIKIIHNHLYPLTDDGYFDAVDKLVEILQDDCADDSAAVTGVSILISEDPADTLSEWSAWTEISRSGGDSTTVNDGAAVVTTATAGSDVEFVTETTTQNTLINTTAVIAVEERTRTVVINGNEDATPPTGTLSETRDTEVSAATSVAGEPVVTTREVENDAYEAPATLTLLGVTASNASNSASVSIAGDIESLVSPGATISVNGVQYSVVTAQHFSGYTTIRIVSGTTITAAAGSDVYLVE